MHRHPWRRGGEGVAPQGPPAGAAALSGKPRPSAYVTPRGSGAEDTRLPPAQATPLRASHAPRFVHVTSPQGGPALRHGAVMQPKPLIFPSDLLHFPFSGFFSPRRGDQRGQSSPEPPCDISAPSAFPLRGTPARGAVDGPQAGRPTAIQQSTLQRQAYTHTHTHTHTHTA